MQCETSLDLVWIQAPRMAKAVLVRRSDGARPFIYKLSGRWTAWVPGKGNISCSDWQDATRNVQFYFTVMTQVTNQQQTKHSPQRSSGMGSGRGRT